MEDKKYRHEFKYPCSAAQLAIIQSRLDPLLRKDKHVVNGSYRIRSMYFDNYANRCYYENENGTDPREKFRIRIYDASKERISLECKRKENGKTYKTSCLLSLDEYYRIVNNDPISIEADQPKLLKNFLILKKTQLYKPSVIVEYDRIPYVYQDGNVRVTLDMNISSSDAFENFLDETIAKRQILPAGQHLLEVKYDEFLPEFIKSSLESLGVQRSTFSKFYLCKKFSMGVQL